MCSDQSFLGASWSVRRCLELRFRLGGLESWPIVHAPRAVRPWSVSGVVTKALRGYSRRLELTSGTVRLVGIRTQLEALVSQTGNLLQCKTNKMLEIDGKRETMGRWGETRQESSMQRRMRDWSETCSQSASRQKEKKEVLTAWPRTTPPVGRAHITHAYATLAVGCGLGWWAIEARCGGCATGKRVVSRSRI
jgi:hypothetical protein